MSKIWKNRNKLFAILLQAALISAISSVQVYASKTPGVGSDALIGDDATGPVLTGGNTESEEEVSPYTREQLEDGTLEYGEIEWRIEGYNTTYLNLRSQLYSQATNKSAGTALAAEASELMEDALDLKSDDMDAETRELFEGYKAAAKELRKQGAKLTNKELSGTYARMLRQTKNKLVKAVQNLVIQYEELVPQVEVAKKNVEMCQVNVDAAQKMQEIGRASEQDVLTAQKALQQATSGAQQAENGALQLKQNILMLLGFDVNADVKFADVPVPDDSRLSAMNISADTQAAVSANYDLMSVRNTSATGSSNRSIKKRNVAYTEDSVKVAMQNLYEAVIVKKQAYESEKSGYEAAAQTYEASKRQNELGMLSKANYLGLECSWLGSAASYKTAQLEYTKAVENYEWAVKGLIVTN